MISLSSFEMLPDELLLQICRYLYKADVLYSLFNLNTRLNGTITNYCHFVNLMGVTCYQFNYVVCHILPQIAPFIRSFVFHAYREKLLSVQASAIFYARPMSFTFPLLRRITLSSCCGDELLLFIDRLQDFEQLVELNIQYLTEAADRNLLRKVLTANNGRLQSVSFDPNSASLNVPEVDQTFSCLNIQKLVVKISAPQALPHLFALVPYVHHLSVNMQGYSSRSNLTQTLANLSPLCHLIDFQLLSINLSWNLENIHDLLRQTPLLQTLTLNLRIEDEHFIKSENFTAILPSSLKQVRFLIDYHYSELFSDVDALSASWSLTLPISCLLDEINSCIIMVTTSSVPCSLNLPAVVGKQIISKSKYLHDVNELSVHGSRSLSDVLCTVQHFHRLRELSISAEAMPETELSTPAKQPILLNLPLLKRLEVWGICNLFDIIKAARNLDTLIIDFDELKVLIDDESTCDLLQQRIDYLHIRHWPDDELDLVHRFTGIFPSLRHLSLTLTSSTISNQSLSTILAQPNIKQLTTLIICGKLSNEIDRNLRQWVIDHTYLTTNDSFAVAEVSYGFTLWN